MRTRHAIWTILLQQAPRNIWGHMSQLILADTLTLIINEIRIKKVIIKIFTWFYILLSFYTKLFLRKNWRPNFSINLWPNTSAFGRLLHWLVEHFGKYFNPYFNERANHAHRIDLIWISSAGPLQKSSWLND